MWRFVALLPLCAVVAFTVGLSLAQLFTWTLGEGGSLVHLARRFTIPACATLAAVLTGACVAPHRHLASAVVVWCLICTLTLMLNVGRLMDGQIPTVFNVTLAGCLLGGALGCLIVWATWTGNRAA